MGIIEKIKEIEAEMARTQKNKATGSYTLLIEYCRSYYLFWCMNYLELGIVENQMFS